ncbi:MAG: hypothetical protein GY870_06720 [archaeon]|nr:hypothetical protein [archaeon]
MSTISIIKWANSLGITEPVNGSWIEAIARHYGDYGDKPHIQSIANSLGITEAVNGSWLQAICQQHGVSEGPWLHNMMNDGVSPSTPTPEPEPPAVDPCSVVQNLITENIGQLGGTTLYYSYYKLYNYNRSGWIYTQSEVGDCKAIRGIEIHYKMGASTWTSSNQKVYVGHITDNQFPSSFPINLSTLNISDLTLVYEGDFNFVNGTNNYLTINFDTNFTYNGTDNLFIHIIDDSGNYTFSGPQFKGVASSYYLPYSHMSMKFYQDAIPNNETDNATNYNYRPNTKLLY